MRKIFLSFHYKKDNFRVQQIKNMGAVEGQPIMTSNQWEKIKQQGDAKIWQWIKTSMRSKSTVIVLVGAETASRPWVKREIDYAWNEGKAVMGIKIHKLLDSNSRPAREGANPFVGKRVRDRASGLIYPMEAMIPVYNPVGQTSQQVYASIKTNINKWIEDALVERRKYD